ncbi:MAG: ABC transporter permease [Bdellovibrionales bacterium]|nr:ABC transporter permease [Bdellovibrionales bacterium]
MLRYFSGRLLGAVATFFVLSYVIFQLMALMPGDPVDTMASSIPNITAADIARLKALYGLDKPGYVRFWNWFSGAITGDLGYSRTYQVPVTQIVAGPIFNTFLLSICSLSLALLIAIPLGVFSALKKNSSFDYIVNFFAFAGISVPSFWLGIVLIILFSVTFQWLPAGGTTSVELSGSEAGSAFFDRLKYLILPVTSLMFFQLGSFVRYTRNAMLEILNDDFIRTARAKGLDNSKVVFKHALRNALIPLITVVSISMGFLLSGAIITETVFAYNGLGRLVYDSIMGNDFNVAMVGLLLVVGMVLLMNMVADFMYAVVDPRVSYEKPR